MPRTKQCRQTRANGSTSAKVATPTCVQNRAIVACSARSVRWRALQSKPVATTLAAVPKRRGSPTQQPSKTDQCRMPGRLPISTRALQENLVLLVRLAGVLALKREHHGRVGFFGRRQCADLRPGGQACLRNRHISLPQARRSRMSSSSCLANDSPPR